MKPCVVIPCFNHAATVAEVARAALAFCPVIVVDDGSTVPLPAMPGCKLLRLERNAGKGAALRAGFARAQELGFTHAITMDADGQHFAEDLPQFLAAAEAQPDALLVGVRDFYAAGAPAGRRRSNAVSTFWYRVETGIRLGDTQCGFRGYPLELARGIQARSGHYAFELEFLVRAAWVGAPVVPLPVKCVYSPGQLRQSHFRPILDLAHITIMNIGLVLQSWFVPRTVRIAWSFKQKWSLGKTVREFLSEHTEEALPLSLAVGLGLFFGIAPIWGVQMVAAAAVAHWLRLNKAITLIASNISMPPLAPFIVYGGLALGHRVFGGAPLAIGPQEMTAAHAREYFWEWFVGSLLLGVIVSALGTAVTYAVTRAVRSK